MNTHASPPASVPPLPVEAFAHVDHWVFDLDNTLYSHEAKVWPQVNERITLFLLELFGLDGLSSHALRRYYYERYGTTLKGLMEEHDVDPDDFLDFAHQIDLTLLDPDPALGDAIAALPGRKLILTNGSRGHAENVAGKLGILHHFEDIFDIVQAGFLPKPERATYENFLAKHAVDPGRAAMFEDIEKNLVVPSALGMKTVLIIPRTPDPFREVWEQAAIEAGHVHYVTDDLTRFLAPLGREGGMAGQGA
ncbi:pyrimidine 5'-nucleotidase [Bosea sp. 685]|uniref:pyrimidine 5'-nucleotidase n=1 Tax=Bosea sp. 685 TaxID=3080057 RepID=UPI00289297DC|nr:pyrimidine 5'-nucleotidase [Bosea sp. 685]WNJ90570.1 pyrimidine 5'-nucleotidase [Bosea sp. 685]